MDREKLFAWCETHAGEQLELLRTLAAIPAPSHHEEHRAGFILDWLRAHGAESAYIDSAGNVVLPFGERGPYRVFMAHTDVVFPDTEALPVTEDERFIRAPGVGDDTANVTALMLCAKYLLEECPAGPMPVLIVFNSCEEGLGNLKGSRQIMEDYAGQVERFVTFDGQYTSLVDRAVGSERWRVTAATAGGHSYSAFGSPNAIERLAGLIGRLYSQEVPAEPGARTTYNVGTISGGTSVNTIAQSAEMTYEYRSDSQVCLDRMRDQFQALLREADCPEARFTAELIGQRPCGDQVPQEAHQALLDWCAGLINEVTGCRPRLRPSSTDANIPLSLGIPAVSFGLYLGGGAHTREEYVEKASLLPGLKIGLLAVTEAQENATYPAKSVR